MKYNDHVEKDDKIILIANIANILWHNPETGTVPSALCMI